MAQESSPWRTILKLALLALGVLLLGLTTYPRAFTEAMRQGQAHRDAGAYGAALEAYKQAARHDPDSPLPHQRMGEITLQQHRYLLATVAFREAARLGGGVEALLGLGESYAGRGDWAAAMPIWMEARALAEEPTHGPSTEREDQALAARSLAALGHGSLAQGRFNQAVVFLTEALRQNPDPATAATAHRLLGRLLVDDDPQAATEHLRQAGDKDMLAVLAAAEGEPDAARRALLLGAALLQRDELPLARRHLEQAVALAPADAGARAYLAHIHDRQGETVAARGLLDEALTLDPDSPLVHYFVGTHQRLVGNPALAQEALWTALQRDPLNAALRVEMAKAFLDLHDYAHAEEWYRGAVDVAPDDLDFSLLLADFYLSSLYKVAEGGVPAAEAAVNLAPDDARTHDLLGWAYHLSGRHAEAYESLVYALRLDPDLVSAHYHLGSLYVSTGRPGLAGEHWQRVVDLDTEGYFRQRAEMLLADLE